MNRDSITICFTDKRDGSDLYRTVTFANVRQIAAELSRISTLKMTRAEILGRLENDLKRAREGYVGRP